MDFRGRIIRLPLIAILSASALSASTAFDVTGIVGSQLADETGATEAVFPIAGAVPGLNGTFYRTDVTLLNPGTTETVVLLEYFVSGEFRE